ncbi:MAG: hypothetical protein JJE28_00990 [Actinomycetales bacterium]|nr:hypothetical protein [Actinomycetales bacterium]
MTSGDEEIIEHEDDFHDSRPSGEAEFTKSAMEQEMDAEQSVQAQFPDGFGFSLQSLTDAQYEAVMTYLRKWVEWLRLEFAFTASELAPCWFQHSDICYELYAMCLAENKVWSSGEVTTMPAFALMPQLELMRNRLRGRSDRCNVARSHVPAAVSQFVVDEDAWTKHSTRVSGATALTLA